MAHKHHFAIGSGPKNLKALKVLDGRDLAAFLLLFSLHLRDDFFALANPLLGLFF